MRPGSFSTARAVAIALGIGLLGGLVGQGGSFILIPLAVTFLKVPLRIAMGSNMVIIFFASLAGFLGKAATGQVPLLLAGALLAGILPGSLAGVALSRRVPTGRPADGARRPDPRRVRPDGVRPVRLRR